LIKLFVMHVIVVGGGIIGLSSAYYLQQSGHQVTVLDQSGFLPNCSHGNAGYVCPSHFIPLATPGIVKQGLRWMLNSTSPFYIQPRLNTDLIKWGWHFIRSANAKHVANSAIPLRDIALFSQVLYEQWNTLPGFQFAYEKKGLLEIFQTKEALHHAEQTAAAATAIGLSGTRVISKQELATLEPHIAIQSLGALWFPGDAHLYPAKLMEQLTHHLIANQVQLLSPVQVTGFETQQKQITGVHTNRGLFSADAVVLAAGSWSSELTQQLKLSIPLAAGRGYSITLENSPYHFEHPTVLVEGRVALTPMDGNKLRIGGTMEITSTKAPPHFNRVKGILHSVNQFFPEINIPFPSEKDIWYGYRPCSADGLPYIGKPGKWDNLVVATGHAMIGLSLGAGTGKLVAELVDEQPTSVNMAAFHPDRFSR
jgi:D-amino-acid dehydrogenase